MFANPRTSQGARSKQLPSLRLTVAYGLVLGLATTVVSAAPLAADDPGQARFEKVRPTSYSPPPLAVAREASAAGAAPPTTATRSAPPAVVKERAARLPDPAEQQRRQEAALRDQQDHLPLPVFAKIIVPAAWRATIYAAGGAPHTYDKPVVVGLRARHRYALSLSTGPKTGEHRYYGTIEVLRGPRLPEGMKGSDVPVPVRFDDQDVAAITQEHLLTKIVVLEDPASALSGPTQPDEPIRYEATAHDDPIAMAKQLGRLVMVIRIGTRVPTTSELAGITVARSLLVPRRVPVADSANQQRIVEYFIYADEATSDVVSATAALAEQYSSPPVVQSGWISGPKTRRERSQPRCVDGMGEVTLPQGAVPLPLPEPSLPLDEYLTDGGDHGLKAGVNQLRRVVNIDPGDTVADWTDRKGVRRFTPSNEVAVYAPRYVEVRFAQGIEGFHGRLISHHVDQDLSRDVFVRRQTETVAKQIERPSAARSRMRASGLANEQWSGSFSEVMTIEGLERRLGWAQTIEAHGPKHVTGADQAFLAAQTAFARTLTREQHPQAIGMTAGVGQVVAVWKQQSLYITEEQPGKPSRLTIAKRASVTSANIGEAVEFIIDYKNTGEETIHNIAIVDSLVSRLEYVQGSADSSRDAIFTAQENEAGSHTLRWEIKEPLKGGQTGTVRFQARVR